MFGQKPKTEIVGRFHIQDIADSSQNTFEMRRSRIWINSYISEKASVRFQYDFYKKQFKRYLVEFVLFKKF